MTSPSISEQRDYITVNFGNARRLTVSFGGEKASGAIPADVWAVWSLLHQRKAPGPKLAATLSPAQLAFLASPLPENAGERVKAFVDQINIFWPAWNAAPPSFSVGQTVKFDFGPRRGGMDEGVITAKGRTNFTVAWKNHGLVALSADLLAQHNA